jgi:hypothetical protein
MTDGKREAQERFASLVELMGEIGANDMGWFTAAQAAKYHRATETIVKLSDIIDPPYAIEVRP